MNYNGMLKVFYLLAMIIVSTSSYGEMTAKTDNSEVEFGSVQTEDVDISEATATALQSVDTFISLLNDPSRDRNLHTFGIKVSVEDGDIVEHIWLGHVKFANGQFTGVIGNPLRNVKNYKMGKLITLNKNDILDWAYFDNKKMIGNFTLKALFPHMNPVEVSRIKEQLGWQ